MIAEISKERLFKILNVSKNLKCDQVIVPKNLFQTSIETSLVGTSNECGVIILHSEDLKSLSVEDNWNCNTLNSICFESRLLNPFLKLFTDSEGIVFNKLSSTKIDELVTTIPNIEKLYDQNTLYIEYNNMEVNGLIFSIATSIHDKNNCAILDLINPNPIFRAIRIYYDLSNQGKRMYDNINITDDINLMNIMNLKASEGGRMWRPNFLKESDKGTYITTLTSNLLNLAKGDTINMSIIDELNIPNSAKYFMSSFTIIKTKKKMILTYIIMNFKLN